MKIALVTPELHSLVRRTNLAAVAESLALALRDAGADARVFLPHTVDVDLDRITGLEPRGSVRVPDPESPGGHAVFELASGQVGGVPVHLFSEPELFGERHPYGDDQGVYSDNWRRYALFARAVLESLPNFSFEADLFHCMDWTTGLLPVYHRLHYVDVGSEKPAARAGTYFAIHNLAMQGAFEREVLPRIDIPHRYFRQIDGIELGGKVNYLKAGADFATIVGTHSPSHALKIQEKDRGFGLEETFQRRKKELVGISNGIDYHAWDPSNDPLLPAPFSTADKELAGKRKCKAALQASMQLDNGPRTPLAAVIGRWDADSGFDLVAEVLTQVLERNVELVVMGSGAPEIQQRLKTIEGSFLGRLRVIEGYQVNAAHLIMGGADMLLLPAHYQPSNSLFAIAMRYGVAPLVYAHSGLEDAVVDMNTSAKEGTGFHFSSYTSDGLLDGVLQVLQHYKDAAAWKKLVGRCLAQDFSWGQTAGQYLKAYRRVTRRVRTRKKSA